MVAHKSYDDIEEIDDPTEVIEGLLEEWRNRKAELEGAIENAEELAAKQDYRGRRKALEYGISWIESSNHEEDPSKAIRSVCGHLADAATNKPELENAGPIIGPRHTAFRDELREMTVCARKLRHAIQETLGERPDIDDLPWVSEEVQENAKKAWDYGE